MGVDDEVSRGAEISTEVASRLVAVHRRVHNAAVAAGRDPADIRILLATKTLPVPDLLAAIETARSLGLTPLVGENRIQELVTKGQHLVDLAVETHFIGHLQSNKINHVLRWVSCIESIDSLAIAEGVASRCAATGRTVDVLVQVNVSGETSKFGVAPADAAGVAIEVAALAGLRLRGFMTIGANSPDVGVVRAGFAGLREVRDAVLASGAPGTAAADQLSMGMSRDLELAIAQGATIVRIGTAIFGSRPALR